MYTLFFEIVHVLLLCNAPELATMFEFERIEP